MSVTHRRNRVVLNWGFVAAIVLLLVVGVFVWRSADGFLQTAERVSRHQRTLDDVIKVRAIITRAESEQRGYLLTHKPGYLQTFSDAPHLFEDGVLNLKNKAGLSQYDDVREAEIAGRAKLDEMRRGISVMEARGGKVGALDDSTDQGLKLMQRFEDALGRVEDRERDALEQANEANLENRSNILGFLVLGLLMTALSVIGGAVVVSRDAARRIQLEEALQQSLALQNLIFDSVNSAIIAVDPDGRITRFNRSAHRWLGYSHEEALGGMTPLPFHLPEEMDAAARELSREFGQTIAPGLDVLFAMPQRGERYEREWTYVRSDGSRFPVMLSVSALRNDDGRIVGYVCLANNLTKEKESRRQLEQYVREIEAARAATEDKNRQLVEAAAELKESRDVAVAATRTKSEFLANMSHEIRTPMNGVLGMAHLLQTTTLNDRQRGFVRTIVQSAESLLTILNDILDLSKMEAGKMTLEHFPFNLRTVIEDICETLAPVAHGKGLELSFLMPGGAPELVLGDPNRLRQVLTNLLGNAIKFTHEGEVTIAVSVVRENPNRASYRIAVKDTGIGIPKERQDRVFESFTQADGSTTRQYGGTGLGLTISRQIVELMGGEIGLLSELGQGSEFWIEVPLQRQERPEGAEVRKDLGGRRVLIADDNATNRTILRELLTTWNCEVVEAQSGAEALEIARRDRSFDCAILDMHMPGIDGLETARQMRRQISTRRLPMALLSSSGFNADDVEAASLFAAVLFKPVRSGPLYNALMHVTGGVQQSRPEESQSEGSEADLSGFRVLVVEDNMVNQMVANELLSGWECEVEVADNGEIALRMLEESVYDVVLMDVQMPVMDGFAATMEIRRRERETGRHVPILAMTANAMSGDRERCLRAGMDGYLPKPLQPALLRERLLEIAGKKEERSMSDEVNAKPDAIFEPARLDETCGGKASLKIRVIERYLPTSQASMQEIEAAAQAGDASALAAASHALKGSSLTIGSPRVAKLCQEVEHAAREGQVDLTTALSIRGALDELHEALRVHVDELKQAAV